MQKWIEVITIDRDASKARFKVRRVPAVTPEIAEALKSVENEGSFMSSVCARNRNMAAPATLVAKYRYVFRVKKTV